MTSIEITGSDNILSFSCSGHAHYAEKGKDIVCAGISALCAALLRRIRELEGKGHTQIKECVLSDGCFILRFTLTEKAEDCLRTVMCGFEFIAGAYPENCRIADCL